MVMQVDDDETRQLQRLSTLEYILIGDLRDLLEEPANAETKHWMETILDALLETLPREFEIRESGSYLQHVVETYPRMEHQVLQLKSEHVMLVRRLKELRKALIRKVPFQSICGRVQEDLKLWMRQLNSHNHHESRLLQEVVNQELGAGD
jgi:hypothetical protein